MLEALRGKERLSLNLTHDVDGDLFSMSCSNHKYHLYGAHRNCLKGHNQYPKNVKGRRKIYLLKRHNGNYIALSLFRNVLECLASRLEAVIDFSTEVSLGIKDKEWLESVVTSVITHSVFAHFFNPCILGKTVIQLVQYFWNSVFLSVDPVPTNSLSFPRQQCLIIGLNTGKLHYWSSRRQKFIQTRGKRGGDEMELPSVKIFYLILF